MREPTEREILEVMDALLGFYSKELKRGDDQLTMRQVRLEAERACRAFLAAGSYVEAWMPTLAPSVGKEDSARSETRPNDSGESPKDELRRLTEFVYQLAKEHCDHSMFSSEPPECAIERRLKSLPSETPPQPASEAGRCHHGWRGTAIESQINTPCPACGATSLFIGEGGHLICARVPTDHSDGCHSPSVEETVNALKAMAADGGSRKTAERWDALIQCDVTDIMDAVMMTHDAHSLRSALEKLVDRCDSQQQPSSSGNEESKGAR